MPEDTVVQQVKDEIARLGGDFKKSREDLEREMRGMRAMVEETKGGNVETIRNMETAFSEKFSAFDKLLRETTTNLDAMREQHEQLATALRRTGGGTTDDQAAERRHALLFEGGLRAVRGADHRLPLDPDKIDMDAYRAYARAFPTAMRQEERGWGPEQTRTLMVAQDPAGGFLVPPAISDRIVMKVYESSPIRALATVDTIGTDALELAVDLGELDAGWVGETQPRPETDTPVIANRRITVHEMYAQPMATQKFLEDTTVDIERWLSDKASDKFARMEATAHLVGNGINKPRGLLTYPAGTGYGKVQQYVTGSASAITAGAIMQMPWQLKEPFHRNARWLFKRGTLGSIANLTGGDGTYLFSLALAAGQGVAAGNAQNAPSAGLLAGYPVSAADDIPAVAANAIIGAFGDFRRAYQIVDRLGLTLTRDPYTAKPFVKFYMRRRTGGDVVDFDSYLLLKVAAA